MQRTVSQPLVYQRVENMYVANLCASRTLLAALTESSCTQKFRMPRTSADGRIWSDDERSYLVGSTWVLAQPGRNNTSDPLHRSTQSPSLDQYGLGASFGTTPAPHMPAGLSALPQSSTSPCQQKQHLVFGTNRQTPGKPGLPQVILDENLRAGASKDTMLWAFVQAADRIAKGEV